MNVELWVLHLVSKFIFPLDRGSLKWNSLRIQMSSILLLDTSFFRWSRTLTGEWTPWDVNLTAWEWISCLFCLSQSSRIEPRGYVGVLWHHTDAWLMDKAHWGRFSALHLSNEVFLDGNMWDPAVSECITKHSLSAGPQGDDFRSIQQHFGWFIQSHRTQAALFNRN